VFSVRQAERERERRESTNYCCLPSKTLLFALKLKTYLPQIKLSPPPPPHGSSKDRPAVLGRRLDKLTVRVPPPLVHGTAEGGTRLVSVEGKQ